MKNVKLVLIVGLGFLTGSMAWGTHMDPNNAWVGGINTNPVNFDPKTLASASHQLTGAEKDDIEVDDGDWYRWYEPSDKDYDFMIFSFENKTGVDTATCHWQLGIDHDSNACQLFYWHKPNQAWVNLATNGGGRWPNTVNTNIINAFINNNRPVCQNPPENVSFMVVGSTPAAADNWIQCDVCDIDYTR